MKTVEDTRPYPQPAKRQRTAAAPDTRDEKALPRSEAGIKQIRVGRVYDSMELENPPQLCDANWVVWRAHMIIMFRRCGVEDYVKGTLPCPDPAADPKGAENWSFNDNFAQLIITVNVTSAEDMGILGCESAHKMWKNLEEAYKSEGFKTILAKRRKLCHTTAREGDDIVEHLDKLKQYRNQINFAAIGDEGFKISDFDFNRTIADSLPPSWDPFTGDYARAPVSMDDDSGMVSSQRFIDLIEREYRRREECYREYIQTCNIT